MGTRSTIAILREDGTVSQIYCHWDGYLEHNGRRLFEFYNTPEKVEELIALGDISSLGTCIGEKHPFDVFLKDKMSAEDQALINRAEAEDWTFAYGRDRGESGTQANRYHNLESYQTGARFEEYNYVFMHGEWTVMADYNVPAAGLTEGVPVLLSDALAQLAAYEKKQKAT